jgi:hypothetical protein
MALAQKIWKRITVHKVVLEFLVAEREGNVAQRLVSTGIISSSELAKLLDTANIDDPTENFSRLRLLCRYRCVFLGEIPPDTRWYEVCNLTHDELFELHVVGRCGWDDPAGQDRNEVFKVAERKNKQLLSAPSEWKSICLWGHSKEGPFTIIEGNNRLVAYASSQRRDLNIPVIVGLSPSFFYFNLYDPVGVLVHDLWKGT